jgi:hypothetical protein
MSLSGIVTAGPGTARILLLANICILDEKTELGLTDRYLNVLYEKGYVFCIDRPTRVDIKILVKCVSMQWSDYIFSNNYIYSNQIGFMSDLTTDYAFLNLTNNIHQQIDKR